VTLKVCVGGWYEVVPSGTYEILLLFYVDTEVISLWKWIWIWVEVDSLIVEIFAEQPLVFGGYLVRIGE